MRNYDTIEFFTLSRSKRDARIAALGFPRRKICQNFVSRQNPIHCY
jgi:hypothetical protein